jgi:hypothetical protein
MKHPEHSELCELNVVTCRMGGRPVACTRGVGERTGIGDVLAYAKKARTLVEQDFDATRDLIERLRDMANTSLLMAVSSAATALVEEADDWLASHPKRTP